MKKLLITLAALLGTVPAFAQCMPIEEIYGFDYTVGYSADAISEDLLAVGAVVDMYYKFTSLEACETAYEAFQNPAVAEGIVPRGFTLAGFTSTKCRLITTAGA